MQSTLATLALMGAAFASAALAEDGPRGPGDRGAMFLEMFDEIDADADGKVTEAELQAHRAARFSAADANGDSVLNAEELSAEQLARFTEKLAKRTAKMIESRDDNGDGGLSLDEVQEGPAQRHFARLDSDGDGAISKPEAEAAMALMGKRRKGVPADETN